MKIGLTILIISIVGLILSTCVPWYMLGNGTTKWIYFADDTLSDTMVDRHYLSIWGFVLGIIFSSLLFAFGLMSLAKLKRIFDTLNITFGALLLLSATLCLYSGATGIGRMIYWAHVKAALPGMTGSHISIAPFIVFVLGFVLLLITIIYLRHEFKSVTPQAQPSFTHGGGY